MVVRVKLGWWRATIPTRDVKSCKTDKARLLLTCNVEEEKDLGEPREQKRTRPSKSKDQKKLVGVGGSAQGGLLSGSELAANKDERERRP
jgi:hypothetical protein